MGPQPSGIAAQADAMDQRYHLASALGRQINKVFPTHWSFLLGEIALGAYVELHQPLGSVPPQYQGAPVPKRVNKLGLAGSPGSGSFLTPDPASQREPLDALPERR